MVPVDDGSRTPEESDGVQRLGSLRRTIQLALWVIVVITIIGGLSIATVLTLFLTPIVYEILHRLTDRDYDVA